MRDRRDAFATLKRTGGGEDWEYMQEQIGKTNAILLDKKNHPMSQIHQISHQSRGNCFHRSMFHQLSGKLLCKHYLHQSLFICSCYLFFS